MMNSNVVRKGPVVLDCGAGLVGGRNHSETLVRKGPVVLDSGYTRNHSETLVRR